MPSPPKLLELQCEKEQAYLKWSSGGENNARITGFIIEREDDIDEGEWEEIEIIDNREQLLIPESGILLYKGNLKSGYINNRYFKIIYLESINNSFLLKLINILRNTWK